MIIDLNCRCLVLPGTKRKLVEFCGDYQFLVFWERVDFERRSVRGLTSKNTESLYLQGAEWRYSRNEMEQRVFETSASESMRHSTKHVFSLKHQLVSNLTFMNSPTSPNTENYNGNKISVLSTRFGYFSKRWNKEKHVFAKLLSGTRDPCTTLLTFIVKARVLSQSR